MKRLLIALVLLTAAALACDVNPPAWTPSPPQLTAGALNATYEARASQTAQASGTQQASPDAHASLTQTPAATLTLTSSIVEVTPGAP
jgi:hypothetical protein